MLWQTSTKNTDNPKRAIDEHISAIIRPANSVEDREGAAREIARLLGVQDGISRILEEAAGRASSSNGQIEFIHMVANVARQSTDIQ